MAPSAITIAKIPRKRRSFEGSDPIQKIQCLSEVEYSDDDSSSPKSLSPQMDGDRRAHHNELERRRRDHIKDHFMSLKDAIPLLDGEKSSRALILKRAVEYIAMMRKQIADNQNDIAQLRQQNKNLELQIKAMNGPYRKTSVLPTTAPQLFIDDDSTVGPSVSTLSFCTTNIPNNNTSSSTLNGECLLDAAANPLTNSTILSSIQSSAKPQQSTQAINLNLSTIHQSSENSAFTVPQYLNHKTSDCKADKNDIHSDININNDSSSSTQNNAELLTSPALNPLTQSAAQASNATTTSPTAATSSEFIRQNILRSLPNPLVNLSSLLYANNCSLKFNQSFPEFDYTPDIHSRIVANSLALQNDRQLALTTVRF